MSLTSVDTSLVLNGKCYRSRLLVGTGKYRSPEESLLAIEASGAEIVTVAIRRAHVEQKTESPSLLETISSRHYTVLPNTAGCYEVESAVRTCLLARELLNGQALVKLEVLGDVETLYPDIPKTIKAAEQLIKQGFAVMVYTNDDPVAAKTFEQLGCVAIMPLAAPIGSGLGIRNPYNIRMIAENSALPVLVDAGVGTASDATVAMELGCDGVLMNTAIAKAQYPVKMAGAMKKAVEAGREAYLAGRMPRKGFADASSPIAGVLP